MRPGQRPVQWVGISTCIIKSGAVVLSIAVAFCSSRLSLLRPCSTVHLPGGPIDSDVGSPANY
eukprot:757535-Hanusia_phi.AAC.5